MKIEKTELSWSAQIAAFLLGIGLAALLVYFDGAGVQPILSLKTGLLIASGGVLGLGALLFLFIPAFAPYPFVAANWISAGFWLPYLAFTFYRFNFTEQSLVELSGTAISLVGFVAVLYFSGLLQLTFQSAAEGKIERSPVLSSLAHLS